MTGDVVEKIATHVILRPAVLALAGLVFAATATGQIPAGERQMLIDVYHATGGEDWRNNDGWLGAEGTECEWYGIQCRELEGQWHVGYIDMRDNRLNGELPSDLSELSRLTGIELSRNRLGGSIPPNLWGLESLQSLSLIGNELTGGIPDTLLALPSGILLAENRLEDFTVTGQPVVVELGFRNLSLSGNRIDRLPSAEWLSGATVGQLDLSDNQLAGPIDANNLPPTLSIVNLAGNAITALEGLDTVDLEQLMTLDLSGNRLSDWPDNLDRLPQLSVLLLADNRIENEIPNWLVELPLVALDLSDNDLSGKLPIDMDQMDLAAIDLSNNDLHGPIDPLLAALGGDVNGPRWMMVANNQFTGHLSADFDDLRFSRSDVLTSGQSNGLILRFGRRGLDLCWNELDLDPELAERIAPAHRGGHPAECLNRQRSAFDLSTSGSWYTPGRTGEGTSQMLLDNGQVLSYWFTYPPNPFPTNQQMWLVGLREPGDQWLDIPSMEIPIGGQFGQGQSFSGDQSSFLQARIRQDRVDDGTLQFTYDLLGGVICMPTNCSWEHYTERFDQMQLTELAGTSCDNQSDLQQYSGAWYNPERSGEGFVVEVLPDDRVVVYWFTYQPDQSGNQAWMIGSGTLEDNSLYGSPPPPWDHRAILTLYQPSGASFGPAFDPEDVEAREWGELEIRFEGDDTGQVVWNSEFEDYGNGDYFIDRLAQPMLADCSSD